MTENRIYKWDNVKCFLILSVVIGHFSNNYIGDSTLMRMITLFIYSFHMPMFIFVSGLLSRPLKADAVFSWEKPIYYVMIGYFLKLVTFLIKYSYGKNVVFDFFGDNKLPWYMFAMAAFLIINYLLRKVDWKIVLPTSIILACLAGYVGEIGNFLYLSRIIVFFPFYYLGYILKSDQVLAFTKQVEVKILSLIVLATALYYSTVCIDESFAWLRLFTSRIPYEEISIEGCGFQHRLFFYGMAVLMGIAIITLVPGRRNRLAEKIGKNTLQIYAWHRSILYIIVYSGLADRIIQSSPKYWSLIMLGIAFVLTIVLSQKMFALPLDGIKSLQQTIRKEGRIYWRKIRVMAYR